MMSKRTIKIYKLQVSFQLMFILQLISIISINGIRSPSESTKTKFNDANENKSSVLDAQSNQKDIHSQKETGEVEGIYINTREVDGSSTNHVNKLSRPIVSGVGASSDLVTQQYHSRPIRVMKKRFVLNSREEKFDSNNQGNNSISRLSKQLIKINHPHYPNLTHSTAHTARTRITVSGASVRDHLLPLAIINLSRNGKPERTEALVESSRVITVPNRLILPEDALKPEKHTITVSVKQPPSDINQTLPKPDSRCPQIGVMTIEHQTACDKYYYCEDGLMSEVTCPNGLMYGTRDLIVHFCVHRWQTFCGDKSIPNPVSSPGCRWQYGIFHVQGSPKCSPNYYECTAGKFKVQRCRIEGQVYDDRRKSCQPAQVVGCANELVSNFRCPPDDQNNSFWPFPRYFLNERAVIHCVNDKPEVIRCSPDERVDPDFLHCSPVDKLNNLYASDFSVEPEKKNITRRSSI